MACDLTTPGPVQKIGLFVADDCLQPVYGIDTGYIDDCATVGGVSPEDEDTRDEFLKVCPNGDIRAYVPARTVTKFVEVQLNFPWLPQEFLAAAGTIEPVVFNGEVVGWNDCDTRANLIVVVWQELLGGDSCTGGEAGPESIVTLYPLRDVRISEDGEKGTSDFNYTIIGKTQKANIGSGPIPLFWDSAAPEVPSYPDECLVVCRKGVTFKAAAPPAECGIIDTTAPAVACTTTS